MAYQSSPFIFSVVPNLFIMLLLFIATFLQNSSVSSSQITWWEVQSHKLSNNNNNDKNNNNAIGSPFYLAQSASVSDPTSCATNQDPLPWTGQLDHTLEVPCVSRCRNSYYSLSEENRMGFQFHWSVVLKKGQFPGAEVDQNIVNMYPDRPIRHNPNATVEQLRRYSIIDRKGPSYGNLRIENLKPEDAKLFLCQYSNSMQLGKMIQVNVTSGYGGSQKRVDSALQVKQTIWTISTTFLLSVLYNQFLIQISCRS
ncbi:uncharacterized protein LOC142338368 [Convolutriloba macropyga]|uniref:uncharacterized protein LOC142338368 n=1 Tax=Convolutriloba macropyga TaxID=536237 RepID=UPI003F527B98